MNPLEDFRFLPDGARAHALDLRMRRTLAESLEHIAQRCSGHVRFEAPGIEALARGLAAGQRLPPSTFGLYADLVVALYEDRLADAEDLIQWLARERPLQDATRVIAFDDPLLDAHRERYARLMGGDPDSGFVILPPSPGCAARFRQALPRAMSLMRAAMPALADELDALVSELVMVRGEERGGYQFDGGSCYMLWGALFLNVALPRSPVALLEVLAHESAHMLLYGFSAEEALVLNDDDEGYPSPLRADQRPMDGIYHATWVSARMHWAMGRLLESDLLDAAGRDEAREARDADARNFAAGDEVVRRHGRLTSTGEALMSAARDWMAHGD